jgi:hypothetical protein
VLAGLIIATAEAEGEAGLCAELPIAGQTLIEHQARLLSAAGAGHIVVQVERLPASLLSAIDRLKRDGIAVEIARSVTDAADRIHPHQRLILLADGLISDLATIERLIDEPGAAVLVLPDTPDNAGWERIDAAARWGGIAVMDGALLRQTAAMLGDWSLQSTLLRRAVQDGAVYVEVPGGPTGAYLAIVEDRATATLVDAELGRRAARDPTGIPDRFLFAPIAHLLSPRAMQAMLPPVWFRAGAVVLTIAGGFAFLAGWFWTGMGAMLLAGPLDSIGRHIGALGWRSARERRRWDVVRMIASAVALLMFGWFMAFDGRGREYLAIAAAIVVLMGVMGNHQRLFGKPSPRPAWLAEVDSLIWLFLPFAIAGLHRLGLVALGLYALLSLLETQRRTARKV